MCVETMKIKKMIIEIYSYFCELTMSVRSFNSNFYEPIKAKNNISWTEGEVGFFTGHNGKKLNYLYVKPDDREPIASVFILHGNNTNIENCENLVMPFVRNGYQVYIFDYQGFGESEGDPTHNNLLHDAEVFLNFIKLHPEAKGKKLLVAGFSLGGHLSIAFTARNQNYIDALVVEGAFTSHKDIAVYCSRGIVKLIVKMFLTSKYSAKDLVSKITIPKLIVHSSEDIINPFFMGQGLYDSAISPKEFWEIKGGHIEGFKFYENAYFQKITELISICKSE